MGNSLASVSSDLLAKIDAGDAEGVKALLTMNLNTKNIDKRQLLNQELLFHSCYLACKEGEDEEEESANNGNKGKAVVDKERRRDDRIRIVNMLIEAGMDINMVDESQQTVLHEVASHKNWYVILRWIDIECRSLLLATQ